MGSENRIIKALTKNFNNNLGEQEIILPNFSGTKKEPTMDKELATKKYVDDNSGGSGNVSATLNLTDETIVQGDGGVKNVKTSTATVTQIANNVTHSTGNGSDHANVATNTTHITSNGSDHSYIDQDVTSGSSPTLDGTNITGVASVDVADESADTTCFPVFATTATGAASPKTGSNLTFNASTGVLGATNFTLDGDNSSADTTYVPLVLYNTDATPPTASTVPIGTIYIQYTA